MIRHIIYSFKKYQTEPNNSDYGEIMERDYAMMLNFFLNANVFIYLIKNSEYKNIIKSDDNLPKGIKFFRDCFAHQHEKELSEAETNTTFLTSGREQRLCWIHLKCAILIQALSCMK